jgi:uncharacterized repeat protein (TIGR01451 family)
MKLMSILRNISKRTWGIAAVATAVVAVPASLFAWGPDRPTFTVDHPADHVTFNSITDAPNYGDERNFVTISTDNKTYSDDITVTNGGEYYVRIYVHNNAASNLKLVANNVVAKLNVPTQTASRIQIDGYVNSSNASPTSVWDQAVFHGANDTSFKLSYVAGSAYYKNAKGQFTLSDSIVSSGTKLGYDKMDGNIPGCFEYSGVVYLKVKAQTADFSINKTVRKGSTGTFAENVTANPSDKVDYQLYFKNTGGMTQTTVTIKDILPAGMTYVAGSTYVHDDKGTRQVPDGIVAGGMTMGNYASNGDVYVKFTAQVAANDSLEKCGTNNLVNTMKATTAESGTKTDTATVTVSKTCTTPEKIQVCRLSDKTIITINKEDFDSSKYSKNLNDCKDIKVCRISDKTIVNITLTEYNQNKGKYSTNLSDCDKTSTSITVCRLSDKTTVVINSEGFDSSKYSKTLSDCDTSTPEELPHTGAGDVIISLLGAGSLTAVVAAYVASRRAHLGA